MNYIVHDKDGNILKTGICPQDMVQLQAGTDEFVMEGAANDIEHRIVKGKIVRKSEAEINAIKEAMKPDPKELLISQRMSEIVRKQAIKELTEEGKI